MCLELRTGDKQVPLAYSEYFDEDEYGPRVLLPLVFLPCLNWEHANALEFAVGLHISDKNLVACATYSPTTSDHESDTKSLWYKIAFKALAKYQFVSLYCSEQELGNTYADLLSLSQIPVRPFYLMDWAGTHAPFHQNVEQYQSSNSKRYLLYMRKWIKVLTGCLNCYSKC